MTIEFDPTSPAFVADPYPVYRRLQEEDPVHWSPAISGWVVTRYDDVRAALQDRRLSNERPALAEAYVDELAELPELARLVSLGVAADMNFMDEPGHTRLRGLVSHAFTPRAVEGMRRHMRAIVAERLDELYPRTEFDIVVELCGLLPLIVMCQVLGVPREDVPLVKRCTDAIESFASQPDRKTLESAQAVFLEMETYLGALIVDRRREPKEDIITGLLFASEQGERLTDDEVRALVLRLLGAGEHPLISLIGNGMRNLVRFPEQLALLRSDRALVASAVEELLRFESPASAMDRVAREPLELGGKPIEPGQMLYCSIAAANRDPRVFDAPDRLDIRRADNRHLAFSHGIHRCLGNALARMGGQEAIAMLVERLPAIESRLEHPEWVQSLYHRELVSLPVTCRWS